MPNQKKVKKKQRKNKKQIQGTEKIDQNDLRQIDWLDLDEEDERKKKRKTRKRGRKRRKQVTYAFSFEFAKTRVDNEANGHKAVCFDANKNRKIGL